RWIAYGVSQRTIPLPHKQLDSKPKNMYILFSPSEGKQIPQQHSQDSSLLILTIFWDLTAFKILKNILMKIPKKFIWFMS
ncbi:MAG: hypothetical protein PUG49_07145, partial [Helicobacter sp.]|nr:hypothetical protein [Helicobacter sp.]